MEYDECVDKMRGLVCDFFVAPAIILVEMFGVGAIIDHFINATNTFSELFVYVGGIPGIGMYYYKKYRDFNKSID